MNQRFLSWVALPILFAVCALAQKTSATLQGTVKDATGSVIPAARISITKIDTGVKSSTASNNDGYFTFPPVAIGRYLVDLATPPPGTVCPSDRLPFDPEFGQPAP